MQYIGKFIWNPSKFRPQFNETIKSPQFCKLSRQNGENAEEWMGTLWLSVIEYNYKELDKLLKEQFIHGPNDTDMLRQISRELTKIHKNTEIPSENMLCWAKRVEVQRAQSVIMNSLTEAKEFDKIKITKITYKIIPRRLSAMTTMATKQTCRYCGSSHPLRQFPAYGKKCTECSKIAHFRVVCRSRRVRAMNEVGLDTAQDKAEESGIGLVNINSVHLNKTAQ